MKKITSILIGLALLCSCTESDREHTLKVYNWSTYIDETLIGEFEQWYQEQTGEPVHVIYQTFDVLETMLSKIEKGHEDFDVVCPSDYIIERMAQHDLLIPLNKDYGNTPNYIDKNISPFIKGYFDLMDCGGRNANDLAGGYMWGTTGILYNAKYVTEDEASTWEVLRNPKFKGQILMKDSGRDVCSQIIIHLNQDRLAAGTVTLDELMYDSSDETLQKVEAFMKDCKQYVAGWEADFGKEQMLLERALVNLNWSGDSQWAIDEAAEVGIDLRFVCPREGFTIFFDGWVIPKYAKNIKAANYWINFLCRQDIAIRNSDEIGYVSVCGGDEVKEAFIDDSFDPIDVSYFFGPADTAVCINPVMYPDASTIARSAMEHDWGDKTPLITALWSRVKGDNASTVTYIVIAALFVALVAAVVWIRSAKWRRNRKSTGSKRKKGSRRSSK